MKTLVYLSYGQGGHVGETVFSILSAFHRAGPGPRDFGIVVYTDDDRPLQAALPSILPKLQDANWVEEARRVYAHRPRPRLRRRCRLAVVHRFQDAGLFRHRMRASG